MRERIAFAPYGYVATYALRHPLKYIRHWLYEIKFFFQRGWRGWADRDTWSIDYYLSSILPGALRHLQEHSHTYVEQEGMTEEEAVAEWGRILHAIADGFEASVKLDEGEYIVYTIPPDYSQPMFLPLDSSDSSYVEMNPKCMGEVDKEATQANRQALFTQWEEGIDLFKKHFFNLWD